jgi:hypothetical protein
MGPNAPFVVKVLLVAILRAIIGRKAAVICTTDSIIRALGMIFMVLSQ